YAAQVRVSFFTDHGFPIDEFVKLQIGPILFREETQFLKEVGMNEIITIDIAISGMREDGSRWKIVHQIFKANREKAAIITVEGAWMDLIRRKLVAPPETLQHMISKLPKTENFQVEVK